MTTLIILGIIAAAVLFGITIYNKLVKSRQMVQEGWSGIDVQLKKRANLIPNLVAAVKGYMKHEKGLLEKITELRARAAGMTDADPAARQQVEQEISSVLGKIFVAVENYPDLKANQNVLDLQQQLAQIENDIQMARRYYNGAVRDNNVLVESFPSNLIANYFRFEKAEYFELENAADRQVPQVNLG
ncbi:MAG TPA: LemA family protein [Thermopetrobacter sp.]|nr:LemA family protein [Thermopetrobacter sp.]